MNQSQRISTLESAVAEQGVALNRILALLEGGAPAKVTRPKAAPKAKAQVSAPVVKPVTLRHLVKANRKDFVQAHPWAAGLSTLDIAIAFVHCGAVVTGSWAIGEGYDEKARQATPAAIKAVKAQLS